MSYRVKTICRLTGINRSTLLAWERRYGVVTPTRADNGYRVYTEEDLDRLIRLKALVDKGHAVSEALGMLGGASLNGGAERILERLADFDHAGATSLAEEYEPHPPGTLVSELYMPALTELGERWARGETSVAQEHFASGFVRERLMKLMDRVKRDEGRLAAFFTAPGEKHELGLLGAAVRLAERGWRTDWLGPELPLTELPAYCRQNAPELMCTSLIRHRPPEEQLRLVVAIRGALPPDTLLAVGGRGALGLELEGVVTAVQFPALTRALEAH